MNIVLILIIMKNKLLVKELEYFYIVLLLEIILLVCFSIDKNELYTIYREINGDCHIIIDSKENMTKYYSNTNFIKFGLIIFISLILML